jgi:hypothetical protein
LCAHNRAAKQVGRYVEKLEELLRSNPRLKPVFITLTVKNGSDLQERFDHLRDSFRTLNERRRDWKKKGRGHIEFCKIQGAVYSYEVTYNEKTGEWHPHVHIFALLDKWIDRDLLVSEWQNITGDSFVVDVRRVKKQEGTYGKAFCEVFKYALKFSDMSVQTTLECFLVLRTNRLQGSFGLFRGVQVPDDYLDSPINQADLPYLEMLYKFTKSGYSLAATKKIDPSVIDHVPDSLMPVRSVIFDTVPRLLASVGREVERTPL